MRALFSARYVAPVMMDRATTYTARSMASTTLDAGMSATCEEAGLCSTTRNTRVCGTAALRAPCSPRGTARVASGQPGACKLASERSALRRAAALAILEGPITVVGQRRSAHVPTRARGQALRPPTSDASGLPRNASQRSAACSTHGNDLQVQQPPPPSACGRSCVKARVGARGYVPLALFAENTGWDGAFVCKGPWRSLHAAVRARTRRPATGRQRPTTNENRGVAVTAASTRTTHVAPRCCIRAVLARCA